jgi:hypothetical protein
VHSKFGILKLGCEGPNVCATETPIGNVAYDMFLGHLAIRTNQHWKSMKPLSIQRKNTLKYIRFRALKN